MEVQSPSPDVRNPLIGKSVIEGLVQIDNGAWIAELKQKVKDINPQTDKEKVALMKSLTKSHLKDAINAQNSPEYATHKQAIDTALQNGPTTMTEVLDGKYGVCRHYHTYGLTGLEEMGMEAVLAGNERYAHTFLLVKEDGEWKPEDPFAEDYFTNKEGNPHLFPPDCYTQGVTLFEKTSHTKDMPVVNQPPRIKPAPPNLSLDQLKAKILGARST